MATGKTASNDVSQQTQQKKLPKGIIQNCADTCARQGTMWGLGEGRHLCQTIQLSAARNCQTLCGGSSVCCLHTHGQTMQACRREGRSGSRLPHVSLSCSTTPPCCEIECRCSSTNKSQMSSTCVRQAQGACSTCMYC